MFQAVSPQVYAVLRALFITAYLEWGVLWGLVAFHYGRAAYSSWLLAGGRLRYAVRDMMAPLTWAFKDTLCRWGLTGGAAFCGQEIPSPYQRGSLLRFAIFLGSLTPMIFGFYFVNLDRSNWSAMDMVVNLLCVTLSVLAAGGHLFLAYKTLPHKWRRLVTASAVWLLLAPPALYWLGALL